MLRLEINHQWEKVILDLHLQNTRQKEWQLLFQALLTTNHSIPLKKLKLRNQGLLQLKLVRFKNLGSNLMKKIELVKFKRWRSTIVEQNHHQMAVILIKRCNIIFQMEERNPLYMVKQFQALQNQLAIQLLQDSLLQLMVKQPKTTDSKYALILDFKNKNWEKKEILQDLRELQETPNHHSLQGLQVLFLRKQRLTPR